MTSFEQMMQEYWKFTSLEQFEKFFDESCAEDFYFEYGPNLTTDKNIFLSNLRALYKSFPG